MEKERKKNGGRSSTWGKSKGKNIWGGGGLGGVGIVAFFDQWLQKVHKEISLCVLGTKSKKTLLGMCRDSTTQEQKAKFARQTGVQRVA